MRIWIEGELIANAPLTPVDQDNPCGHVPREVVNAVCRKNCGIFSSFKYEINYFTIEDLYLLFTVAASYAYPDVSLVTTQPSHQEIAIAIVRRRLSTIMVSNQTDAGKLEYIFYRMYPILMYFIRGETHKLPCGYPLMFPVRFSHGTITFGIAA